MLISIVIPFHNERENLTVLIPKLFDVIKGLPVNFEVILVNDVSTDGSEAVAASVLGLYPQARLLNLPERGGQTGCYKAAFALAKGDYILRMDADLQDDPEDIPLFVDKLLHNSDLVMGLRECRKHSRVIRMASAVYDLMILALFNSPLHSNSGSYVAFKSCFVKDIPYRKNDHRYLPLIAMRRGAENISEVFVRHHARIHGESKYNPFRKIFMGIPEVFRFLWRLKSGIYDR